MLLRPLVEPGSPESGGDQTLSPSLPDPAPATLGPHRAPVTKGKTRIQSLAFNKDTSPLPSAVWAT